MSNTTHQPLCTTVRTFSDQQYDAAKTFIFCLDKVVQTPKIQSIRLFLVQDCGSLSHMDRSIAAVCIIQRYQAKQ